MCKALNSDANIIYNLVEEGVFSVAKRKSIPKATSLRLFAEAAGHCQNPNCLLPLFPDDLPGDKHIAEIAHVIPHGRTGPRHEDRPAGKYNPDDFENLILLCPNCHTKIDKAPDSYPRDTLLEWKRNHFAKLAAKKGIMVYKDRGQARYAIAPLMAENKAIWAKFAPVDGSEFEYDPESEAAKVWNRRILGVILPNHYLALAIIEANQSLATEEELVLVAEYKEHVRGLSERHLCGVGSRAIRFPEAMERVFS